MQTIHTIFPKIKPGLSGAAVWRGSLINLPHFNKFVWKPLVLMWTLSWWKTPKKSGGLTAGISKKSRNSWCGKILGQASLKVVTFYNNMLLMIKKTYVSKNEIMVLVVAIMSDYIAMYMRHHRWRNAECQLSFIYYFHNDSYYMYISF